MRSVEGIGRTIDEAIGCALSALGVSRDQVEIEILENANSGVLGIGRRKARVRATIRVPLHARLGADEDAASDSYPGPPAPASKQHAGSAVDANLTGGGAEIQGASLLEGLLRYMGIEATIAETAGRDGERVLDVQGPHSAGVIGRRGEVLDALEYLVNRIVERGGHATGRFILDAAGFRSKRRASLEEFARRLAERARQRGKPVTLNPLGPGDRRTVYLALQSESGITARSIGHDHYRKLVIIPEAVRRGSGKAAG